MPTGPFVADARTFDIPNTIRRMILALPPNAVAVTLRAVGGQEMIAAAERAARVKGIRILWVRTRAALEEWG